MPFSTPSTFHVDAPRSQNVPDPAGWPSMIEPTGIYRWVTGWADVIQFRVVPLIEDKDAAPIVQDLEL